MVIRGAIRGNGRQLAAYLLREHGNDHIHLLDVAGQDEASEQDLHDALYDMSVTAELTKSNKGLYHAQINPAPGEDATMSKERWFQAADILGEHLGLAEQRRVIVLHEKKGRTHAHVVWERYQHDKGIMVSDSFSRLAQDRARGQMEQAFNHKRTPKRNVHRPELKKTLTDAWAKTQSGAEFVREAKKQGYMIAEGVPRHPFMAVDENGRSFDLVRQLQGVRIKEVRARMKGEILIGEKEAIEQMRAAKSESGKDGSERERAKAHFKAQRQETTGSFAHNREDIGQPQEKPVTQPKVDKGKDFAAAKADMQQQQAASEATKRKNDPAKDIAANKDEVTKPEPVKPAPTRNELRQQFKEQMRQVQERQRQQRERGREPD